MPREQWHLLYYILAGLNFFTILAGFIFFHSLLGIHGRSVDVNGEWVRHFGAFEELAQSVARMNGPGNDIFESRDARTERDRLGKASTDFNGAMAGLRKDLGSVPEAQRNILLADLDSIGLAAGEMAAEAEKIFSSFEAKDAASAGRRMATMDRKYALVSTRLANLRSHAVGFQREALLEARYRTRVLGYVEIIFALLVCGIIVLTAFYGLEMTKRLRATSQIIADQQQSIQATAKLSALGEMAGGIAHEINNPLAIIQMRAVHLREMQARGSVDRALLSEAADAIERTTDRIACIIRGLRTFARDARKDPFRRESMSKVIGETLSFCRERFKHRGIGLEVQCPEDLEAECRATELSQVLLNLLNNAADAVSGSRDAWVMISARARAGFVEIRVMDSGSGIPAGVREKMMQPFFTTKDVGKGTGLGLSITKGIIESHRGKFWYDPGSTNTCFVIELPIYQPGEKARSA